jgi:hypothetical protein
LSQADIAAASKVARVILSAANLPHLDSKLQVQKMHGQRWLADLNKDKCTQRQQNINLLVRHAGTVRSAPPPFAQPHHMQPLQPPSGPAASPCLSVPPHPPPLPPAAIQAAADP